MIKTNEYGQPNEIDTDTRALVGDIGLQVREILPIGFEEFEDIPLERVQLVLDELEVSSSFFSLGMHFFDVILHSPN